MTIERIYPSNATQAGLLHEATKPALDAIYDALDAALVVSAHPLTFGPGWSANTGSPTVVTRIGDMAFLNGTWLFGTGASFANLGTLPEEVRPAVGTVAIGLMLVSGATAGGARLATVFCNGATGVMSQADKYNTGSLLASPATLHLAWRIGA